MEPHAPILSGPTNLEFKKRTTLPLQLNPFGQLTVVNLFLLQEPRASWLSVFRTGRLSGNPEFHPVLSERDETLLLRSLKCCRVFKARELVKVFIETAQKYFWQTLTTKQPRSRREEYLSKGAIEITFWR
jgi:hypothetical protein